MIVIQEDWEDGYNCGNGAINVCSREKCDKKTTNQYCVTNCSAYKRCKKR